MPNAFAATLAEPEIAKPVQGEVENKSPETAYNVVLLDDDDHSYEYVIEMLVHLFFITKSRAFRHAEEVDKTGRTIVITCDKPQAMFAKDQIQAYGADPRMPRSKGSMSAVVEPA